jgi:RNA polymerase sigma-70 factor (ECF subfamily)
VQAHPLHLFIGEIGIGPFARTARSVGDHHTTKPLVAAVKALGDAVVGGNLQIVLMGNDAQMGHALQGLDGAAAIGNEDIVLGVAKSHSPSINPALRPPQPPVVRIAQPLTAVRVEPYAHRSGLRTGPKRLMPENPATPPERADAIDAAPKEGLEPENQRAVALMLRVKQGDEVAFAELVEAHQHMVIHTAARMLGSLDDGHDIAQQVFLRVWKSAPRYEPSAKFSTWLFTILRNLVFNETRKRKRRREIALDDGLGEGGLRETLPDNTALPPDRQLADQELQKVLDKAIDALPEKQRLAIILRRYEELPYEQICDILKLSLPALKSMLFRARSQLRKDLSTHLGDKGEA